MYQIDFFPYPIARNASPNVPRVPQVGDQWEPILVERSAAGYSLLGDFADNDIHSFETQQLMHLPMF